MANIYYNVDRTNPLESIFQGFFYGALPGHIITIFSEWAEYAEYGYVSQYKELAEVQQNDILNHVKPETFEYTMEYSWKYIQDEEYYKAKKNQSGNT